MIVLQHPSSVPNPPPRVLGSHKRLRVAQQLNSIRGQPVGCQVVQQSRAPRPLLQQRVLKPFAARSSAAPFPLQAAPNSKVTTGGVLGGYSSKSHRSRREYLGSGAGATAAVPIRPDRGRTADFAVARSPLPRASQRRQPD